MKYSRDTIVGAVAIIVVVIGFAATGGLKALLWFISLVAICVWSWWLYTFKTNSKLMFYGVKVPANILLNPLLLLLLLGSFFSLKFKYGKHAQIDTNKPNHEMKADEI